MGVAVLLTGLDEVWSFSFSFVPKQPEAMMRSVTKITVAVFLMELIVNTI
ncbi:hypothetical protein [Thermococcus sp. JdF3]|nr:hypothetical protein [Thermococcus sp. JdF3]